MLVIAPGIYCGHLLRTFDACQVATTLKLSAKAKVKRQYLVGFMCTANRMLKLNYPGTFGVTNLHGIGLRCAGSGTNVEVTECCFKKCGSSGISLWEGATVTATQ